MPEIIHHSQLLREVVHCRLSILIVEIILYEIGKSKGHELLTRINVHGCDFDDEVGHFTRNALFLLEGQDVNRLFLYKLFIDI